jgi:hypothetical protein
MKHEPRLRESSTIVGLIQFEGRMASLVATPGAGRISRCRWQAPPKVEKVRIESTERLRGQLKGEWVRLQQRLVAAT